MKRAISGVLLLCLVVTLTGCKSISPTAKDGLAKDVDCSTAPADIQTLTAEKASVAKKVSSGVRSVWPVAAVVGLLSGDYKDRVSVATGKYNKDLEAKIQEIKTTCGIQ